MRRSPNPRREDLSRDDKGRCIWPKVEEELRDSEARELPGGAQVRIATSQDAEHQRADEEALDLDPAAAEVLDEEDGEEVAGYVAGDSNYEVSDGVAEEDVVVCCAGRVANVS